MYLTTRTIKSTRASATNTGIAVSNILIIEDTTLSNVVPPPYAVMNPLSSILLSAGAQPRHAERRHGRGYNLCDGPCAEEYGYADNCVEEVLLCLFYFLRIALRKDKFKPDNDQKHDRHRHAYNEDCLKHHFEQVAEVGYLERVLEAGLIWRGTYPICYRIADCVCHFCRNSNQG